MLEGHMRIEDQWLARFKEVVRMEISESGGRPRDGYRAVAEKLHKSEEYIYQLFNGKPVGKPKKPSSQLMDRIAEVYGNKNHQKVTQYNTDTPREATPLAKTEPPAYAGPNHPIEATFRNLASAIQGLDETGKRQATSVLSNLVDDPASCDRLAMLFKVIVETGKRRAA